MLNIFKKILDYNQREIDRLQKIVSQVNDLEEKAKALKDADFKTETDKLKSSIQSDKQTLDEALPWAFALVREASRRTLGLRHFDEQVLAGVALHEGKVAEQKTGEGKTLTATLPLYLNALNGKGVHLVTVNDYLARRDAGWMGMVFNFLGLTTSSIIGQNRSFLFDESYQDEGATDWRTKSLKSCSRQEAYAADITYGINSEFGFDYLRDNMAKNPENLAQRGYTYAIIDEVDSVLIDEARTPHIISAPFGDDPQKYAQYTQMIKRLDPETDYVIDEKMHTAHLTEKALTKLEKMLHVDNIYEEQFDTVFHLEAALKADALFKLDKDYVVRNGEIVIVDEFTGRLMPGRRWSEGIHQAIEAKEGVAVQKESKTLATVSLQNYFRMYEKLGGMTGTAQTEAEEFHKIYKLEVIVVPTHAPMVRADKPDYIYKTTRGKYGAVVEAIANYHIEGRPVLVGTTSIDKNEILSSLLKKKGIPHQVLNAKNHEAEAQIIADAGRRGAVTVATNMAGRGVDIILGGEPPSKLKMENAKDKAAAEKQFKIEEQNWQKDHDEVVSLGGLVVIGTERHESRRIDNQLRGRSGRQGDPGETRFFVSLEDDLMRIFGGEQVAKLMTMFKIPENTPLEHSMVSRALEQAQVKVEGFNFDARKNTVEYDDVLNKQREIIYGKRRQVLLSEELKGVENITKESFDEELANLVNAYVSTPETRDIEKFNTEVSLMFMQDREKIAKKLDTKVYSELEERARKMFDSAITTKKKNYGEELWHLLLRTVYLDTVDTMWVDHLTAIEDLRLGVGLRARAQLDPLTEYKNEAFSMFESLLGSVNYEFVRRVIRVEIRQEQAEKEIESQDNLLEGASFQAPSQVGAIEERKQEISQEVATQATPSMAEEMTGLTDKQRKTEEKLSQPMEIGGVKWIPPGGSHKEPGRNDPCPCGSGLKYKKCGLINAPQHKG